ncbi:hypothetical protein A2U01_0099542, partial [Trifolium medium]|nr:hypothetical protein [Trifolium medium]
MLDHQLSVTLVCPVYG